MFFSKAKQIVENQNKPQEKPETAQVIEAVKQEVEETEIYNDEPVKTQVNESVEDDESDDEIDEEPEDDDIDKQIEELKKKKELNEKRKREEAEKAKMISKVPESEEALTTIFNDINTRLVNIESRFFRAVL